MRPVAVAWLVARGLPGWLVPDYFVLTAVAAVLGGACALRLARRDGEDARATARTLALAYVGALVGGYAFESLRMLPRAVAAGSLAPMATAGRAAYGGLLGAIAVAAVDLRRQRRPIGAFLDRTAVAAGLAFALVRTGCFLAGCDYGRPTASALGVRFPSGSLAALDHARRGWVPRGAASLPVHPTQLYEAALGLVGGAVAVAVLRRGPRDGRAFAAFLAVYAIGRFAVESLRGDDGRGAYLGASTAQWVSLALLVAVAACCVTLPSRRARLHD